MSRSALRRLDLDGPWERLQRAESEALRSLLSAEEWAAVSRRLWLPASAAPVVWIPPTAGPEGARFNEPHGPGALFLGVDLATCVAEVCYHHARACAASLGTPPGTRAVFRHLLFQVHGAFADAAGDRRGGLHDPGSYAHSWAYGRRVRAAGLDGVRFRSVRQRGGFCLAVFNAEAVAFLRVQFGAVVLDWDGVRSARIA